MTPVVDEEFEEAVDKFWRERFLKTLRGGKEESCSSSDVGVGEGLLNLRSVLKRKPLCFCPIVAEDVESMGEMGDSPETLWTEEMKGEVESGA